MSDWELLRTIISDWQKNPEDRTALRVNLDEFHKIELTDLTYELCQKSLDKNKEHVTIYNNMFNMAQKAIELGLDHSIIGYISDECKTLALKGKYLPIAHIFLFAVLKRNAVSPDRFEQSRKAFDALVAGINKEYREMAQSSMLLLSILLPRLEQDEREKLRKKMGDPGIKGFSESAFLPTIDTFIKTIKTAEDSIKRYNKNIPYPSKIISVHSHKGGVGKTTIAAGLAFELASDSNNKVCLVDCDDDGPSLLYTLPFQRKQKESVFFFVDWFDKDTENLSFEELIEIEIENKEIFCIPGSFISTDITRLDQINLENDIDLRRNRIIHLLKALERLGFNCVIFDTGPGLSRLSFDVLNATFAAGGSQVFVMRPRAVDISQFCIEWDWIHFLKREKGTSCAVINFTFPEKTSNIIDLKNGSAIVKQMQKNPLFDTYNNRLFALKWTGKYLGELIKDLLEHHTTVFLLPESKFLRHAEDISISPLSGTLEAIKKDINFRTHLTKILGKLEK